MKLSFWTLGMPPWSNRELAEHASELGYGGIDLRCTKGGNISADSSPAEVEEVMSTYAAKDITIASLLGYQERGNGKEPVDWDKVEADLIALGKLSTSMNNVPVRITVGYTDPTTSWDTYLTNLAKATMTAIAEVPDVTYMFQNHAGSATATQLGEMCEKKAHPRFRFGYSPDHCYVEGEDPIALAERFAPLVSQLHIADRKRTPEGGYEACWIGDGIVPHAQILEILAKHGFDGWVSLKWERGGNSPLPMGDALLPHYIKYMNSLGVAVPAS